jgi:hypothetical protein
MENNENPTTNRRSVDDYRLWEVIMVFEYLKSIHPACYHSAQNVPMSGIEIFGSTSLSSLPVCVHACNMHELSEGVSD